MGEFGRVWKRSIDGFKCSEEGGNVDVLAVLEGVDDVVNKKSKCLNILTMILHLSLLAYSFRRPKRLDL